MNERIANTKLRTWLLVGLLVGLLFALESVAVHAFFTARFPGGNDFYSRWAGARALLLEGRDPYSLDVTVEIQAVIGVDPIQEGKGGFAYPLYVLFLFWPLVYLPYDWTLAIWIMTLQWVAMATVAGLGTGAVATVAGRTGRSVSGDLAFLPCRPHHYPGPVHSARHSLPGGRAVGAATRS